MARKVRIEYENAYYHVINRGNYRSWIFESEGARDSFLECLVLACEAKGWRLHGWCLMGNHYHLLLQTPVPNLVDGMKWLQSTFSNRFNRYRKANGHVFQGRYKAILLDSDGIGVVSHYIHLNPVRAGLIKAEALETYQGSSFHQLWYPSKRWGFSEFECCLDSAGGLKDTRAGKRLYRDYLEWLSTADGERRRLGFETMSRGWAKGTKEFRKAVLADHRDALERKIVESDAAEMKEPLWERNLFAGLNALGREEAEFQTSKKSAAWKVALARHLRERLLVPNSWLAEQLRMGTPQSVSSRVSRHRKESEGSVDSDWSILRMLECVD
jgi:REP element-mobilizing transposase RayT